MKYVPQAKILLNALSRVANISGGAVFPDGVFVPSSASTADDGSAALCYIQLKDTLADGHHQAACTALVGAYLRMESCFKLCPPVILVERGGNARVYLVEPNPLSIAVGAVPPDGPAAAAAVPPAGPASAPAGPAAAVATRALPLVLRHYSGDIHQALSFVESLYNYD